MIARTSFGKDERKRIEEENIEEKLQRKKIPNPRTDIEKKNLEQAPNPRTEIWKYLITKKYCENYSKVALIPYHKSKKKKKTVYSH